MRILIKPLVLMVVLFVMSSQRFYAQSGNIEGYVFNYDGIGIYGATVTVQNGPSTTSGADGHYFLTGVNSGNQTVDCYKPGYNTASAVVNVPSDGTANQDFILTLPNILISPLNITETLNPGEYFTTSLSIINSGNGTLDWQATVNFFSMPVTSCEYSIALHDTYGDGWNDGTLDVLVNDIVVLDNITLSTGAGPVYFYFTVITGDQITTVFTPASWADEPFYFIYNAEGAQVWYSPPADAGPANVLPGQLYASCSVNSWFTMDSYEGTVPAFGGVNNIPAALDASETNLGEVYTAEVIFTSNPDIATITVPVMMIIMGNDLIAPENLVVSMIDEITGEAGLTWDWNGDSMLFFIIKRNGVIVGTTTSQIFTDFLPDYGIYCYTVWAVYDEGYSSPAGPSCIEWQNPDLYVNPDNLEDWVWTGFTEDVYTTITNLGVGTLAYTFPEFAALDLLNDPDIERNKPGYPGGIRSIDVQKGDESHNGTGYPIVLGAGGPDDFGYFWIDSDEEGGPNFNYTEISTTGTPVWGLSDDNVVGPFNIGFEFSFYGENKTQFWINSNGVIGFTPTYITIGNTGIPTNSSTYKDFIAWFWDDMFFRTGTSMVFYQTFSDKTVIQFKNYERYGQTGFFIDAEVILYRNGKIIIMYDNFTAGVTLNSCTVGIQSSTPGIGLQVAYNATYLHNDLALLFSNPADFIADVEPASGTIIPGGSKQITITYDSEGYDPGGYTQDLLMESNDPDNAEFVLANTMYVYTPARFTGQVTDNDNDSPLPGVIVTAGPFQATTGEDGEYSLFVDEGEYNVVFEKLGYMSVTVADTFGLQGVETQVSVGMWDINYAPGFVHAEVLGNDTLCAVTWTIPDGPYEIVMDDGEADDYFIFAQAGSWSAVKFTPSGYPAIAIGGQIYVGDGNFPGLFLGTELGIAIFDDDGPNGLPGSILDSSRVTVNNYGWVSFDWLNAPIENGSFYLAMYQTEDAQNSAPVGIDLDSPTYFRSYIKFQEDDWSLSHLQDFMIHAWIDGPESDPVTYRGGERMSKRDVTNYQISRFSDFDPNGSPTAGNLSELANIGDLYYNDYEWSGLPQGWYAYGVKAMYTSGFYSSYTISNIVGHLMDCGVTVNVTLSTGQEPINVEIELKGSDYPYETLSAVTPASGTVVLDQVWKGHYDISAFKIGYNIYLIENINITSDNVFNIMLSEKKYPPTNLIVDPLSLVATWNQPLRTALAQNFEDTQFPPPGWQSLTNSDAGGWVRTDYGSSANWPVPAWDSFYACSNDDMAGSESDGCCDYLITPPLDLRDSEGYTLKFDSFYDGAFGQLAFVEYSTDEGETWEILYQVMPDTNWTVIEIDLSAFSGLAGTAKTWFAFHSDDAGTRASGWAIDNVLIQVPAQVATYIDFWVFLNDAFVGVTADTNWNYAPLLYSQTYTASVAAHYSSGLSSSDYYTFLCEYLFPPRNLAGSAPDDAAILIWDPPLEFWPLLTLTDPCTLEDDLPENLLGYNVYRDGVFVDYTTHVGEMEPQEYVEEGLEPGFYQYTVTAVYDLTPYGYTGESGESMENGPAEVIADYCYDLDFMETWSLGNFDFNEWESDGANWSVNNQTGNPAPSAEFTWDPIQANYAIALESYPLCAVGMTEGKIWLDFEVSLYQVNPTGEEKLKAQVWNWDSKTWDTVAEYSNLDGNFDWITAHIDIKAQAMGKVFKIRFLATGVNSLNIMSWFVDNIHIYRTCFAPTPLTAEPAFGEGILLSWQFSENGNKEDGKNQDIGLRELQVVNIYRSKNGGEYNLIATSPGMSYLDPEGGLNTGILYCYKANAVWESASDQCESDFSNEACAIWTIAGHYPEQAGKSVNIYPNPASDRAFITSSGNMNRVTVFNSTGQPVFDRFTSGLEFELKTAGYPAGIYAVLIETASGTTSRLLTIQR